MILGIDEVGRGPWAGPLVVGAVVLPADHLIDGLTDSKKLTAKKRHALDIEIRQKALGYGLGWVHADELDEIGLSAALRLATIRAVDGVKTPYHEIILDGTINFLKGTSKGQYVTTLPKADVLIPAVSAASIIAKVARDKYMAEQHECFPEYGFASHVGYGTAMHRKALVDYGVTPLHRKSFAPIAKLLGSKSPDKIDTPRAVITTKTIGNKGEMAVADWLKSKGFAIEARNWNTRYCEIDIIARKDNVRYFVEVKFRSSQQQGGGVGAITRQKLKKMQFAAEIYGVNYQFLGSAKLAVATVNKHNAVTLIEVE